jgi:hypothetical protein
VGYDILTRVSATFFEASAEKGAKSRTRSKRGQKSHP